jgi:hypothetical protein
MSNVTKTVKSSGGDYTSLNAALAGMAGDLTTDCGGTGGAGILTIECYAMEDTTAADTGTGYTTSADYYINITVPSAERHSGVWNGDKYNLYISATYTNTLTLSAAFVVLDGLQVGSSGGRSGYYSIISQSSTATALVTVKNCIVRGNGTCLRVHTNHPFTIYNSILYGASNYDGIDIASSVRSQINIFNCTVINANRNGLTVSSSEIPVAVKNSYFGGSVTGTDISDQGGTNIVYTTCASEDDVNKSGVTDQVACSTSAGTYFTNITAGSENLHIGASSSLIDVGTSLSATFTTDIDGQTRSGTWDIGADEYVAAGGDPEGSLIHGKLLRGGLLMHGVLIGG